MTPRTSISDPMQIDEIQVGKGSIGLTFCPGKRDEGAFGESWERELHRDLQVIQDWGAKTIITLMEKHELNMLSVSNLGDRVKKMGIDWRHLPIVDLNVPDENFEHAWARESREIHRSLARGEHILVHCRGGLGRTGVVAAMILMEHGTGASQSVAEVRRAHPGAIESRVQNEYVRRYHPYLVQASLLAGALGDSLGADVEFLDRRKIESCYPDGIDHLARWGAPAGWFTDDTQMTMFTAEGLINANSGVRAGSGTIAEVVHAALLRWYQTQVLSSPKPESGAGGLASLPEMHFCASPGNTCLGALRDPGQIAARNDSKGCGTIMRVAPVAFGVPREEVRATAIATSAVTHGHPVGQLAAAAWAELLADVASGIELERTARAIADEYSKISAAGCEVGESMAAALNAPRDGSPDNVERLGGGWVAEEALSVALYAALSTDNLESGLQCALWHSGDSDSTAAIAGNLLGLLYPVELFEHRLLPGLGGRELIVRLAVDLVHSRTLKNDKAT